MSERIEGLLAAPLTGFTRDGAVNLAVVSDYARSLRSDGVVGVFVNGTTGEGQLLTPEERRWLLVPDAPWAVHTTSLLHWPTD